MAQSSKHKLQLCASCNVESKIFGSPLCPGCADLEKLIEEIMEAKANKVVAFGKYEAIIAEAQNGHQQPKEIARLTNASNELSVARKQVERAYVRLSDYVDRGIVPEDLKAKALKATA